MSSDSSPKTFALMLRLDAQIFPALSVLIQTVPILRKWFLEGKMYTQIGKEDGVSHERIRQVLNKDLRDMRRYR